MHAIQNHQVLQVLKYLCTSCDLWEVELKKLKLVWLLATPIPPCRNWGEIYSVQTTVADPEIWRARARNKGYLINNKRLET